MAKLTIPGGEVFI